MDHDDIDDSDTDDGNDAVDDGNNSRAETFCTHINTEKKIYMYKFTVVHYASTSS